MEVEIKVEDVPTYFPSCNFYLPTPSPTVLALTSFKSVPNSNAPRHLRSKFTVHDQRLGCPGHIWYLGLCR